MEERLIGLNSIGMGLKEGGMGWDGMGREGGT